mgnify:CR=1 FL=1
MLLGPAALARAAAPEVGELEPAPAPARLVLLRQAGEQAFAVERAIATELNDVDLELVREPLDASLVLEQRLALAEQAKERFLPFEAAIRGVDDLALESAILGIDGWVCGSGIAFPKENQQLWNLAQAGRWDECRALYRWSQPLMKLDTHIHFVQYIKLLCQETGLGKEWVREPRLPITGAEREQVLKIIRDALAKRPA